ncbi:MAG TPA: DUF3574 domain-containing protein [Thermoanaerobaculia bacterium]|jgi:hypothetical protein
MSRRAAIVFALLLSACAHVTVQRAVVSDRLFCGLSISDGSMITDAQLETFIDEIVVPRFPDGFSVRRGEGYYLDKVKGPTAEPSITIEIVHADTIAASRAVREIAEEYRRRFRQQAVLRVRSPAQIEVIE